MEIHNRSPLLAFSIFSNHLSLGSSLSAGLPLIFATQALAAGASRAGALAPALLGRVIEQDGDWFIGYCPETGRLGIPLRLKRRSVG